MAYFVTRKVCDLKILQVFSFLKYALIISLLPIIGSMNILFPKIKWISINWD